jgi:hypothetical protein
MANNASAANVLKIFRAATADDIAYGRSWYAMARDAASTLDPADPVRGAAVIAVLSPMMPWGRNLTLARQAYAMAADGASHDDIVAALGCLKRNAAKAAALVLGADPAAVVTGPKVVPFWQRIVDAASGATGPGSVVVDRHAHDIALGRVTDDATRGATLGRKGGHHMVAMAYVRAASVLRRTGEAPGITPAELQAVTWTTWRREFAHAQGKAEARRDAAARQAA